jgi:hypothetical protein
MQKMQKNKEEKRKRQAKKEEKPTGGQIGIPFRDSIRRLLGSFLHEQIKAWKWDHKIFISLEEDIPIL